jgi:hypothetical protein
MRLNNNFKLFEIVNEFTMNSSTCASSYLQLDTLICIEGF